MGNGSDRPGWRRRLTTFVCGVTLVLTLTGCSAFAQSCDAQSVALRGEWGTVRFSVELADDPIKQARGLMHREALPFSAGMLFIYDRPRPVSFWMHNTLIPLDMLFLDNHGVVQRIHHNARPMDDTAIPGGDAIFAVLEINGGLAARLGITPGSEMLHPAFSRHRPAWPC